MLLAACVFVCRAFIVACIWSSQVKRVAFTKSNLLIFVQTGFSYFTTPKGQGASRRISNFPRARRRRTRENPEQHASRKVRERSKLRVESSGSTLELMVIQIRQTAMKTDVYCLMAIFALQKNYRNEIIVYLPTLGMHKSGLGPRRNLTPNCNFNFIWNAEEVISNRIVKLTLEETRIFTIRP